MVFLLIENFKIVEEEINDLQYGQVIVEVIWLSLDPYMRGQNEYCKKLCYTYSNR